MQYFQKIVPFLLIALLVSCASEENVKTLVVDDKWMQAIEKAVKNEIDHISQRLTNRIKELAERYETPLPEIDREAKDMESKVNAHLEKMGFVWK